MTVSPPFFGKIYEARKGKRLFLDDQCLNEFQTTDSEIEPGKLLLVVQGRQIKNVYRCYWIFKVIFGEYIGWIRSDADEWEWDIARAYDENGTRQF